MQLVFFKDSYSLPIVDHIANDNTPCLSPYSFSKKSGTFDESQENSFDKWDTLASHLQDGCPKILGNNDKYLDERYNAVSYDKYFKMDMDEVESDSGVLAIKLGFKFFDNSAQQRLKQNNLNFYTRSAIPFYETRDYCNIDKNDAVHKLI